MSDSLIYYQCPSCLAEYQSSPEKSSTSVKCPLCQHIIAIPSKSTFTPNWSVSSQHQEQSRLTAEKVAELFGQEHSNASFPNQRLSRSKLIDCPDCSTRISSSAFFCPICGRPSSLASERAKDMSKAALVQVAYTKAIFYVISMVVSWLIVQYFASFRVEKFQRMEDESRRKYERLLNP